MAFFDNLLKSMKYNDEDFDDEYFDDEDEYDDQSIAQRRSMKSATVEDEDDSRSYGRASNKVTSIGGRTSQGKNVRPAGNVNEVCVIKPTNVNDSREITDTLLSNRTVVLNVEGLDMDVAQRIIDFTSGSTYAVGGNLQKISHYIFIITPRNVDISGDFQEILSGAFDVPALNTKY
ncbi:MAG: cell division protein SepF [Lachnospiraceae bacterium]|nr:cell division protein SepF [Lachnospiraceae bacterium]